MKTDLDYLANAVLFLAVFVGIWELVFILGVWPSYSLPSPIMVFESFTEIILNFTLLQGVGITLGRLVVGFLISIGLGVTLGLVMIKFKGFGKIMSSFSAGLLSFPSIAWVPFSILLIGFNDAGILFIVIMSSVFSITISTYSSIRNIPTIYTDAAKNMGAKGISLFLHLTIPSATPSLIMGIRQSWSFAWHAIVGAEILMSVIGLGHILSVGREFQDMGLVIATMITIFTIGLLVDRLLLFKLEERIRSRWGLSSDR
ncbi:MAG: ABC transporter permease [Nitrosarchaeum sp.]|uniref:ABC transporter permease n=1 Tax=Nitrosarchaeum sp. TaxID=2026886 RepID=UPI002DE30C5E|nr:ABC transporter permease [Nitrosarchaeum sp.]